MIALRVKKNGKILCVAGSEDLGVLSANVTALGLLGSKTLRKRPDEQVDIYARIGGLTSRQNGKDVHLRWRPKLKVKLGDKIEIEVVETDSTDAPDESSPAARAEKKRRK